MKKTWFSLFLCLCVIFSCMSANADAISISSLEAKYGGNITIDPNYEGDITAEHLAIADAFLAENTITTQQSVTTAPTLSRGSTTGTASVWAWIPAVGHCYIYTPYTITYSVNQYGYNDISSCSLRPSYMSGISAATFAFTRNTWSKIGYSTARITAYGTLSYGIPGTPLYYTTGEQAFEADISISGL